MMYDALVRKHAAFARLSLKKSHAVLRSLFSAIRDDALSNRHRTIIPAFGSFFATTRKAGIMKVPSNNPGVKQVEGANVRDFFECKIAERTRLTFRPSKHAVRRG